MFFYTNKTKHIVHIILKKQIKNIIKIFAKNFYYGRLRNIEAR